MLLSSSVLALPKTWAYLCSHEVTLRARERGKMDHDRWWAFGQTQSLGLHDQPKLGVAATVKRLEVAADPDGTAKFHNVRVNGILPAPDGPPLFALLALMNSAAVDFAFRRGAAPLQNGFYTANKQFVSWLPMPTDGWAELEAAGRELHRLAHAAESERGAFFEWLRSVFGVRVHHLRGWTTLDRYVDQGPDPVVATLDANSGRLKVDPRGRTVREQVVREAVESGRRITELRRLQDVQERTADELVYELYGLTIQARALVEADASLR